MRDTTLRMKGNSFCISFSRPIGEESYEIRRDGEFAVVRSTFRVQGCMTQVPLTAAPARAAFHGLNASSVRGQGKTSRSSEIDTSVEFRDAPVVCVVVKESKPVTTRPRPLLYDRRLCAFRSR